MENNNSKNQGRSDRCGTFTLGKWDCQGLTKSNESPEKTHFQEVKQALEDRDIHKK